MEGAKFHYYFSGGRGDEKALMDVSWKPSEEDKVEV